MKTIVRKSEPPNLQVFLVYGENFHRRAEIFTLLLKLLNKQKNCREREVATAPTEYIPVSEIEQRCF